MDEITESIAYPPKILVIVGPTASGKSGLALRLAKKLDGEIVSADSRLIYKDMDIGTAKPSKKERAAVPHHLIDVVAPAKTLTLAEYKKKALKAISGILRRGKLPIVAGGTGLYVRAIVENLEIPEVPPNQSYRSFLKKKGKAWILARLKKLDPEYAARIGPNPRYAERALEVIKATGQPFSAQQRKGPKLFDALVIGLNPGKTALKKRIDRRVEAMFRAGVVREARGLWKRVPEKATSMSGIGYRELFPYLRGDISLSDAKEDVKKHTEQYAKRQMTWWRGMSGIEWHDKPETVSRTVKKWLKSAK